MEFKYNGGDCSQSYTIQENDKFACFDYEWNATDGMTGSGPPATGLAYLKLVAEKDESVVYFDGEVEVGEAFNGTDSVKFEADSVLYVYYDEGQTVLMQKVNFHTSCSQNLFLKDRYGSAQVTGFNTAGEANWISCFVDATLDVVISNEGSSPYTIVEFTSSFTSEEDGTVTDDCLDNLPGGGGAGNAVVPPGNEKSVSKPIVLDMTVRQDYSATAYMKAVATNGDKICEDSDEHTWEAGNPGNIIQSTPPPTLSPSTSAPIP